MKFILALIVTVGLLAVILFAERRKAVSQGWEDMYKMVQSLPPVAMDFSTPEGAILCLEDAFRRKDLDAAIAAKDFQVEARLMLNETGWKNRVDDELLSKTAEALLAEFRAQTLAAWPDFNGLESYFTEREDHSEGVVIVTELCRFPDKGFSKQKIMVAKTSAGWRVLSPVD